METAVQAITDALAGKVSKEIIIFIVSMIPVLELRGSLIAAGLFKMSFVPSYILAVLGNMLPIPFLLLFIEKIFSLLKKTPLQKIVRKIENKALSKAGQIKKYRSFGLFLFVAIPLPGTGAWTGALVASLLKIKPKKAILPIFAGVVVAGLIMSLISFGFIKQIF